MVFRWYKIPVYVLLGAAFLAGVGYVTMALWNVLVPSLFSGPVITYWQAVGLLILVKIFFHSFHRPWYHSHYDWYSRRSYWRKRFEEKMAGMSPEEREKFREEWKRRCGYDNWDKWHRDHVHEHPEHGHPGHEHHGDEHSHEQEQGNEHGEETGKF